MDVSAILEAKTKDLPSADVEKDVEVEVDTGNMLAYDPSPLPKQMSRDGLKALARDNTQIIVNDIFQLPTEKVEDGFVAVLPAPTTVLPREKPVPQPKPPTRWEQFAAAKGISNKKRSRRKLDEATGEFLPRWGKGRAIENDWIVEVGGNDDPYADPRSEKKAAKKEEMARQKKREERNRLHASRLLQKNSDLTSTTSRPDRAVLRDALVTTKVSTASLGKFDKPLEDDPIKKLPNRRQKRMPAVRKGNAEKEATLNILDKVLKKKDGGRVLDEDRAANLAQVEMEKTNRKQNKKRARAVVEDGAPKSKRRRK